MSLFDKINESIIESDNNKSDSSNNTDNNINKVINQNTNLIQENNELKTQLLEANKINNRNIQEINELKSLIKNYNSQIENLKTSYNESIKNIQAQLDFEKEINEKYLAKLVKSNNNINNYNKEVSQENKEILSLLKENKESSIENSDSTLEISNLKDAIEKNNQDIQIIINKLKEDDTTPNKKVLDEILSQQNTINNNITSNNDNIQELINDNYKQITEFIAQNRENHDNTSTNIIKKINDIPSKQDNDNINEIKSLITTNKEELNNATDKIINKLSLKTGEDTVNNIIEEVNKSLEYYNKELIQNIGNNSDITKIEIFNKIIDEISNDNYVNINAYKKIKELNLFDEAYYKQTYDYDLDIDPLLHFIYKGYDENKKPSKNFDPLIYKQSHENIKNSQLNPLVYFVTHGIHEGNIKINNDIEEIKHINKDEIDEEIDTFTLRGVKKSKRKPRLIVSLTTKPENINDLHYTLYSLLNQQLKADKVILWLNKTDFPNEEIDLTKELLKLKNNGLSLRFCEDHKEYNKIIPPITTYPNDILITAKDNIYYPQDWLKILYNEYKNNPETIIAHQTRTVTIKQDNTLDSYEKWEENTDEEEITSKNFANTQTGVLIPPNTLHPDILNQEQFNKYEDDIDAWLWAMSILNHKKIKLAKNGLHDEITYVNPLRETNILEKEKNIDKNYKDITINNIVNKYPEIINIINEE